MNQERHSRKRSQNKRKSLVTALVLAALLVTSVGATVAYLNISSDPASNSFTLAMSDITIEEEVEDGVKKEAVVVNNGEMSVYVRAAVVANTVDEAGNITGAADVSGKLGGNGWTKVGDYYYYSAPVAPGDATESLVNSNISLTGIQVAILAEAIQSEPASAVKAAWGWEPESAPASN